MTFAESGFWVLLALALCVFFRWGHRRLFFRQFRSGWDWLSQWRSTAPIGIGLLGGSLSALMAASSGLPEPAIHDEFSYLLLADTFAQGRLTNPPHPMAEFFETYHVLQQPTYASKYPPATAILLAAGKVFGGHPALGIWLGVALAAGGTCWMMYGWLRPRWAILGSVITCAWLVQGYWSRSYWGGALPMFGGVLVFGALRRILQEPRLRDSLLLGLGLSILANTRPFEGLVISLPAGFALLAGLCGRRRPDLRVSLRRVVLPILGVLTVTAAAMGYYNFRVTGNVGLTPYQLYHQTIHEPPLFLWQSYPGAGPPLRMKAMEDFSYGFCRAVFEAQKSPGGFADASWAKLEDYWQVFPGPILTLALITLPLLVRNRWWGLLLATLGLLGIALLSETWYQRHYAAPGAGLVLVLVTQGLRKLATFRYRTWRPGLALVVVILGRWMMALPSPREASHENVARETKLIRKRILESLAQEPGPQLVVVEDGPTFRHMGWINNEADIDKSRIVWARDLGAAKNEELFRYFKGRRIWSLLATQQPPLLRLRSQD